MIVLRIAYWFRIRNTQYAFVNCRFYKHKVG